MAKIELSKKEIDLVVVALIGHAANCTLKGDMKQHNQAADLWIKITKQRGKSG